LRALKEVVLHAGFSGLDTVNTLPSWPGSVPPLYSNMYRSSILNYGTLGIPDDTPAPTKYLIIADTCFRTALDSLIAWKRQKGDSVIFDQADGKSASFIKNDIRTYVNQGIDYVLLVGPGRVAWDSNQPPVSPLIPFYKGWRGYENEDWTYSDYWYTTVIGDDDIPDVALGRFSVWTDSQLQTVTDKLFSYERYPDDPPWNIKWHDLVSCMDDPGKAPYFWHEVKKDSCEPILVSNGFQYYDDYAGAQKGEDDQDVINHIDYIDGQGVSLVNYIGHGDSMDWCWRSLDSLFGNAQIYSLTNFTDAHHGRPPIVFEIACDCGRARDSDYDTTCHSECWFRSSTGGGVAALGATERVYPPQICKFDAELYHVSFGYLTEPALIWNLGWVINQAKINMANAYDGWDPSYTLDDVRRFHLMGDPEVEVYTGWNGYPFATYPADISTNGYTFPVLVRNAAGGGVSGALVCLRMDYHVFAIGYSDDTGAVYLPICPVDTGTMHVTVTDHNYGPYEGICKVTNLFSAGIVNGPDNPSYSFSFDQALYSPSARTVALSYHLQSATTVELSLFDATGRLVKAERRAGIRGANHASWDCRDMTGRTVGSGVYYIRLKAARNEAIRKVVVL
jgi:hypothetical protein